MKIYWDSSALIEVAGNDVLAFVPLAMTPTYLRDQTAFRSFSARWGPGNVRFRM
jgi:hypothetical protein